ncbi:MAG: VOC family protein [Smithellaceae bacterium]|jgi:predicted enzyme related to lactoylglutathione lyase
MPNYAYDHVHLISSDPVKAAEFYEKAFGAKRTNISTHADGAISVMLSLTGTKLLIQSPRTSDTRTLLDSPQKYFGLEHWGITTDNLDETVTNLKSMGVQLIQEITRFPGLSIAYIMAPDNVIVEIMERK